MTRITLLLFLPLLMAACSTPKPDRVELTDWLLEYNEQLYPATVPGFVHTDLMAHGIIPDPYLGTNEEAVRWVNGQSWSYSITLDYKDLPDGDSLWVVFEGIAGRAIVAFTYDYEDWAVPPVDGEILEEADNMFVEYRFPIDRFDGCKSVTIEVIFNLDHGEADSIAEAEYGIPLPDRRAFTRVAPYQQGWDWGPKLPTYGIWKPVYITNKPHPQPLSSEERGANRFPYRNVRLIQEPDETGQSFFFIADTGVSTPLSTEERGQGVRLFIKGANWIPVHSFPVDDEANRARYRLLLTSAKEAGFNMLRVWGGGIYEHDYFFDLCDSLGLMVWIDFNFSTMLYPDNEEMLESIKKEARQNVTRIARHPCVVLWCGNNEVKNGWEDWGWQGVYRWTPEQRACLQHGIDTLFGEQGILAQAVKDCDPLQRPYITTSPLYGWGHPECVTHGDSHYWGVWWGEEPFEKYKEKTGRFMSEYGFQSYPMISTIKQFCPRDELHIESPTLRNHQKHGRGLEIIDKAMMQYYGFDSKTLPLEDYCYVSQLLQAWGTGYGIFQHIKQQPHCMGTLYWQLNDCWPVASWSSIDYYGNWKALHYRAQALYADDMDLGKWEQYYNVYPKDRSYQKPEFTLVPKTENAKLSVTLTAQSDLYDVYLDTDPHINGHFTENFFDLPTGQTVVTTFIPANSQVDMSHVKVTVRTLNDLYFNLPKKQ